MYLAVFFCFLLYGFVLSGEPKLIMTCESVFLNCFIFFFPKKSKNKLKSSLLWCFFQFWVLKYKKRRNCKPFKSKVPVLDQKGYVQKIAKKSTQSLRRRSNGI